MSRNDAYKFSMNPEVDIRRSQFDRDSSVKFTFNAGDIIPFYLDEVLPGDTFNIKTSKVVRMQPLVTPIMDNVYLDTYYFFVPNRLVWEHWRELNGENTQSAWVPKVEYSVPQVTAPEGGWSIGTIADYMGLPTNVDGISVSALPFRAYSLIMNEWFRDENLSDPVNVPVDDADREGSNGTNVLTDIALGGMPYKASKLHDYFSSALPAPQKGESVSIPVAEGGMYPVFATSTVHDFDALGQEKYPLKYELVDSESRVNVSTYSSASSGVDFPTTQDSSSQFHIHTAATPSGDAATNLVTPVNLMAISSGNAQAATINQLRLAFQLQRLLEKDARGGTRYTEILRNHFSVVSPDSRLQRPEYLGGNRVPININQVVQQSATGSGETPQGTVTGNSLTLDRDDSFIKSFVEHGFVIGLCVARYNHSYQQGIDRMWSRKTRFDYYWPSLAHIGEQAILNKEIFAQGTEQDDEVFGYQEAWADYRYKPSRVAGEMRSSATASLDVWHLADYYSELPKLSDGWIKEDGKILDRVLAISSEVSDQFFADFYIQNRSTRPMPVRSIPGLIDHF